MSGKDRVRRIHERIVETTTKAIETFVPVDSGPDPRLHRHEIPHAVHAQQERAGGAFEESFDYEDPYSKRYLPEEQTGAIIMRPTPEQAAADEAYDKALADPSSVLAPRVQAEPHGARTMLDVGHDLAKRQVSEAHDPDRLERIRRGLFGDDTPAEDP